MFTLREKVWRLALASRIFVISLQCLSNLLIPDHDAQAFTSPIDPKDTPGICDYLIDFLLGGLVRWDAQYFLHIAKYGYTYENCLAFFPLLSIAAQFLATSIFSPFTLFFNQHSLLVLSFTIINLFCFIKTALTLYDLSLFILKDEEFAYRSSIFFCLNPASIFFTAPYSESLFALCTFSGFLCSARQQARTSSLSFGLSCATRSNGILNIGFSIHRQIRALLNNISLKNLVFILLIPLQIIGAAIPFAISIFVSLLPFVMFQIFSYGKFCIDDRQIIQQFIIDHAEENNFKLAGSDSSVWCNSSIPLAYSYVQSHHWDVGFLKYYQWKQIPNFFLAFPIIWLILQSSVMYVCHYPRHCLLLGLAETKQQKQQHKPPMPPPEAFLYVAHAVCLLVFCVLCIHVQVTTRMLASSSPVLYWFAAYASCPYTPQFDYQLTSKQSQQSPTPADMPKQIVESRQNMQSYWSVFLLSQEPTHFKGKFIKYYFILYMIIGTILFSNCFPWT